jgi:dipeptidyl aminopeptidase/acylaminoacyl peptidase
VLGVAVASGSVWGQGTKADYERWATVGDRLRDTVFRDRVEPRWESGGSGFWYRVRTAPGASEFVRVDAERGTKRPAFDAARLAEALSKALGEPVRAEALPIEGLAFDDTAGRLAFDANERRWSCDLASYEILETGPASEPEEERVGRRSGRTGAETELVVVNRTGGSLRLRWVDPRGERRDYGTIDAGAERRQHTYGGHVWELVDDAGSVVRRVEARDEPRRIVVGGQRNGPSTESVTPGAEAAARAATPSDRRWSARIVGHDVVARDGESGEEFSLTTDGTEADAYRGPFHWSPDGRRVVVMREVPAEERVVHLVESSPRDRVQPRLKSFEYLKPGDRIARRRPKLFDAETRKEIPIDEAAFENPWSVEDVRWAADSTRFTVVYNRRGHQVVRLLAIDAATGAVSTVVEEASPTFVDYAHKMFAHWIGDDELIWMSERSGWNHLYLVDARAGLVKNAITSGEWVVRRVEHVDETARRVWFYACGVREGQDPYYPHLCRANLDGTGFVVLTEGDGAHEVSVSPDRRFLVDRWSRVDKAAVTELRDAEDGRLILTLEEGDASRRDAAFPAIERFTAPGRDGATRIDGILVRPSNFDPSRTYPVVEHVYAGPQDQHVPKGWDDLAGMRALAELGFVVVMADGMGTNWRSKAFHDVCWKNLKDAGFPDRIAWLRAAAADRPWLDLSRVGLYGGSAGGQNAVRGLLDHGDFYRAAVADCGCHDNRMDKIWWNELWMGWPVGPEYAASSNVADAAKLRGKLLLIVGELDTNVDPASTMQVVDALVRADRDFELLVIPGAGHGAAESPYGCRRRADFLVRHVMGVEPRRDDGRGP